MKARLYAFAALCALALIFCIGANAAVMRTSEFEIEGAFAAGDPSAADGYGILARAAVGGKHVFQGAGAVLDAELDLGSGEKRYDNCWVSDRLDADIAGTKGSAASPMFFGYSGGYGGGGTARAGATYMEIFGDAAAWEIYLDLCGYGSLPEDARTGRYLLNDYTQYVDNYALKSEFRSSPELQRALDEAVRIPLPGEVWLTAEYTPPEDFYDDAEFSVYAEDESVFISGTCASIGAPDGYVYLVFEMHLESTGEKLDASLLPGGDWGLWRIRADGSGDMESVLTLGADWDDVRLELDSDGTRLLVYTLERGAVMLRVVDLASCETVQELELFTKEQLDSARFTDLGHGLRGYHSEYGSVFAAGRYVGDREALSSVYALENGEYEHRFTVHDDLPILPDWLKAFVDAGGYVNPNPCCYATDGESLCVLYRVYFSYGGQAAVMQTYAAVVFTPEGVSCAWFMTPRENEWNYDLKHGGWLLSYDYGLTVESKGGDRV